MYQCNLIFVKSIEAMVFLNKEGYDRSCVDYLPDGWKGYYHNERCYLEPLAGSCVRTLQDEGKYPYELSASDYKRAVQKENDFFQRVRQKQKEEGFSEYAKQVNSYFKRCAQLSLEVRQAETGGILSDLERAVLNEKKEKLVELEQITEELLKDKMLMYACSYSEEAIRERQIRRSVHAWEEFRYYRGLFAKLLEFEPYICFAYQDEEERREFRLVNTVCLDELQTGDLALLCSNDVLKILL
ncbi:MAG: hypothetical protein K2N94_10600 [Lachnospiraceae bacterium]|nr:hypothetical protein [Lachnospiraceae bacterium]